MTIKGYIDGSFFCLVYSFSNDSGFDFGINIFTELIWLLILTLLTKVQTLPKMRRVEIW